MNEDAGKPVPTRGGQAPDVSHDRFVLIKIEGMHCHRCEEAIRKAMLRHPGVHEVEVDFASGQASVLFDSDQVKPAQLVEAVREAGYKPMGFTQSDPGDNS
jgi:copper chaperone CopZ